MQRRSLLQLLGAATASLGWRPSLAWGQASQVDAAGVSTLRAIAPVVLPSALGSAGADAIVDDFLRWLRGYKPGADMGFGYGILRHRVTPPIEASTYGVQLQALEAAARDAGGSLSSRSLDERRTLVTGALDAAGVKDLPGRPDGRHVIADLMSFYFTSSAANDLCHHAKIGRDMCRTLAGSGGRPERLTSA